MATINERTRAFERVTLTIPANHIDDFRVGVLADLKSDAEGFSFEHANMLKARGDRRGIRREDRDGRIAGILSGCELLEQLPDNDVEATVSGTVEAFQFALQEAGEALVEQLRHKFDYCPMSVEDMLPLLDRLRWTVEQVATIEAGA